MFKALKLAMTASLFALVILVLGNSLELGGRSISDQVRVGMAHAERSRVADEMRGIARKAKAAAHGLAEGAARATENASKPAAPKGRELALNQDSESAADAPDEVTPTERQKLRALLRELNHSPDGTN